MKAQVENPLVHRELRSRMRGNQAVWIELLYAGVLAACAYVFCASTLELNPSGGSTAEWGRELFSVLSIGQGCLLALLVPAFAVGAFSQEREQQTLDCLLVTPVRSGSVVRGKVLAAILFPIVLLTISVPFLALCFLFGGVSGTEVLGTYLVQLANCVLLAAIGAGISLVVRTTAQATAVTYLVVTGYIIGSSCLAATVESGFALAAVGPVTVSSVAGYETSVFGHPVAMWMPSFVALLLAAGWAIDATLCRLRRLRDAQASVRPRLWLVLASLLVTAAMVAALQAESSSSQDWQASPGAAVLFGLMMVLGIGLLLTPLVAVDDPELDDGRVYAWWAVWRTDGRSSVAFLAGLPWLAWLPAGWLWFHGDRPGFERPLGLVVGCLLATGALSVAALFTRVISHYERKRWPAMVVSGLVWAAVALVIGVGMVQFDDARYARPDATAPPATWSARVAQAGPASTGAFMLSPVTGMAAAAVPAEEWDSFVGPPRDAGGWTDANHVRTTILVTQAAVQVLLLVLLGAWYRRLGRRTESALAPG